MRKDKKPRQQKRFFEPFAGGAGCYNSSRGAGMGYCKFCKRELSPSDKPDAHKSCLDLIDQLKAGKPLDLAPEISLWPKDTVEEEVAD